MHLLRREKAYALETSRVSECSVQLLNQVLITRQGWKHTCNVAPCTPIPYKHGHGAVKDTTFFCTDYNPQKHELCMSCHDGTVPSHFCIWDTDKPTDRIVMHGPTTRAFSATVEAIHPPLTTLKSNLLSVS